MQPGRQNQADALRLQQKFAKGEISPQGLIQQHGQIARVALLVFLEGQVGIDRIGPGNAFIEGIGRRPAKRDI